MKKFIVAMLSVLILGSASAFTMESFNKQKPPATSELYWYEVVDGVARHQMPINSEAPITKQELENNAATLLPCELGQSADCVRGFSTPLFSDASIGEVDRIQKN